MKRTAFCLIILAFLLSCKHKKKKNDEPFFSVYSFLRGQVKHVETGFSRLQVVTAQGNRSDTTTTTTHDLRQYAADFLSLPDIATPDRQEQYTEDKNFDELLNEILLSYTADDSTEEVRSETVMLAPSETKDTSTNHVLVQTIIVNTFKNAGDSTVEKMMTWHTDRRFQVVTKVSRAGQPEKITTTQVKWE